MQRSNLMSLDAMQKIINSFKQVEQKIDRLQEDFATQGRTLNDLRIMVGNLSFQNREEEDLRSKIEKRDMSPISLKRKAPGNYKVIKAKSVDPVIAKNPFGTKRQQKTKKAEGSKKSMSGRKNLNNMQSSMRDTDFTSKVTKHI